MENKPRKKSKKLSSAVSNERMTGVWVDLVLDDGRVLNTMLRQTFEDALNGDEKSLRIVLRVFDVNGSVKRIAPVGQEAAAR